jgi:hypothetical protein
MEKRDSPTPRHDRDQGGPARAAEYEAPGIEAMLTPEELEREILYGGDGQSPPVMQ